MGDSSGGMNLAELNAEILAMPEHRLYQQLHGFSLSIYIFDRNFVDLKSLIEFLIKDPRARRLTASRNRDQLQTVQQEIIRFLHNFVAAAQSLIDHTRKLHTKLYGESDFPEYQQRVDSEFKNDPLSQFVKCLRQYAEHYKAPEVVVVSALSRNDAETTQRRSVELLLEDLQAFEGWTSKAKEYLGTQKRGIDVLELASVYRQKVLDFYDWFHSCQMRTHAVELGRLGQKQTEYGMLLLELKVNACLLGKENAGFKGEDIFAGLLASREIEQLERLPPMSPDRATLAIKLLNVRFPVQEAVSKKIELLYREPSFTSHCAYRHPST